MSARWHHFRDRFDRLRFSARVASWRDTELYGSDEEPEEPGGGVREPRPRPRPRRSGGQALPLPEPELTDLEAIGRET